jgi:hypothetical protein
MCLMGLLDRDFDLRYASVAKPGQNMGYVHLDNEGLYLCLLVTVLPVSVRRDVLGSSAKENMIAFPLVSLSGIYSLPEMHIIIENAALYTTAISVKVVMGSLDNMINLFLV